jgi:uncharacterized protein
MIPDSVLPMKLLEPLPFFDLFEYLRPKMQLTLDQYDLLKHSLWLGYGATSWEDLQRVCALLWVKPSYDDSQQKLFDREFIAYREKSIELGAKVVPEQEKDIVKRPPEKSLKLLLPKLPKRLIPDIDKPSSIQAATGIKIPPTIEPKIAKNLKFPPVDLPISLPKVRESWRVLREVSRLGIADEIDVEKTVAQISKLGFLEDVILRPPLRQRSELVVLVDEGDNMLPYFLALTPLFKSIEDGAVYPAEIYRFTGYPSRFLYKWRQPTKSVVIDDVLARLHRSRTVLMVVSDVGGAVGLRNADRVQGTKTFLRRWQLCVRQVLWINPLPEERWPASAAAEIEQELGGKMLWLGNMGGREVQRLLRSGR